MHLTAASGRFKCTQHLNWPPAESYRRPARERDAAPMATTESRLQQVGRGRTDSRRS